MGFCVVWLQVKFETPLQLVGAAKEGQTPAGPSQDSEEEWRERTAVVTSADHQDHQGAARDIVEDLVASLPLTTTSRLVLLTHTYIYTLTGQGSYFNHRS